MTLERMRRGVRQLKLSLALPCCSACLVLVAMLFMPAVLSATPCTNAKLTAATGDFNGDCKSDVLWRNPSTGQVYIWLMNGTAIAGNASPGSPTTDWVIEGIGDFNGDGKSDILWRNSTSGQVYIWLMRCV